MEENIRAVVRTSSRRISATVIREGENVDAVVSDQTDNDTQSLRAELGDFKADLVLNYNISKL